MSITRQELLEVVNRHKIQRRDLLEEGLYGKNLQLADYMTIYNELIEIYSLEEILTLTFEIFDVSEPRIEDIPIPIRPVAIGCISALFEILEDDYSLVGQVVSLMVQAVNKNPDFFIKNAIESAELDSNYDRHMLQLEARAIIEPPNDIQLVHQLAKLYADACEGIYKLAIVKLAFHVNILRNKPRTFEILLNISLSDRIKMVESYDKLLSKKISKPYYTIIRNASAHEGIDLSLYPPKIKMIDSNKGHELTLTIGELDAYYLSLFSLSNVIMISGVIKGMHPLFLNNVISKVDMSKISTFLDMDDLKRRFDK